MTLMAPSGRGFLVGVVDKTTAGLRVYAGVRVGSVDDTDEVRQQSCVKSLLRPGRALGGQALSSRETKTDRCGQTIPFFFLLG